MKGRKASRPILQRKPFKHQLRANKWCAKSAAERKPGCQKVSLPLPCRAERQIVYAYSYPEAPRELLTLDGQTPGYNLPQSGLFYPASPEGRIRQNHITLIPCPSIIGKKGFNVENEEAIPWKGQLTQN